MRSFYVYLYRDPLRELEPIYVGKGTLLSGEFPYKRAMFHWKWRASLENKLLSRLLLRIEAADSLPEIEVVAEFSGEKDALDFERELIAAYGRRLTGEGTLANLTDGGDGVRGLLHSIETRRLLSELSTAQWASEEARAAQSIRLRALWSEPSVRKQASERLRASEKAQAFHEAYWSDLVNVLSRAEVSRRSRLEYWSNPENREKQRARNSAMWEDPELRSRMITGLRAAALEQTSSLEWRASHSAKLKARWADPEFYAAASKINAETAKKNWADPDWRAWMIERQREGRERKKRERERR